MAPIPFFLASPFRSVTVMISDGQMYSHRRQPMQFSSAVAASKVSANDPARHCPGIGRFFRGEPLRYAVTKQMLATMA